MRGVPWRFWSAGGTGYIGSVTVERLLAKGEQVLVLDDLAYGHRAALPPTFLSIKGKSETVNFARIAKEHSPEFCIHFAALIEVGESITVRRNFENNVGQGIGFLGTLVQAGVRRVVFSSTAAVYGDPEQIPVTEQSRKRPKNPYGCSSSSSKACWMPTTWPTD